MSDTGFSFDFIGNFIIALAEIFNGFDLWAQVATILAFVGAAYAGYRSLKRYMNSLGDEAATFERERDEAREADRNKERRIQELLEIEPKTLLATLDKETRELDENNVRVRFAGDMAGFSSELQDKVRDAMEATRNNDRMTLNVAANYGGRWDIVNAARNLAARVAAGEIGEPLPLVELATAAHPAVFPQSVLRVAHRRRVAAVVISATLVHHLGNTVT